MGQHIDRTQKTAELTRLAMIVVLVGLGFATVASADADVDAPATAPATEAEPASIWDDVSSWFGGDDEETAETTDGETEASDGLSDWWGSEEAETEPEGNSDPTEEEAGEWVEGPDGEWEWVADGGGGGGGGGGSTVVDIASQPTGDDPLGYICYRDGREKPILPSDALWLAKMVHGETGGSPERDDADHMLWTIASRTDLPSFRDKSVEYLTRAYSQPINHRWTRQGLKCREYYAEGFEGEIPDKCSKSRTSRRAKYIALDWDEIDELARRATLEFATGQVSNPLVGSIGWLAHGEWRKGEASGANDEKRRVKLAEVRKNTFYARERGPATVDWDEWDVSVVAADQFCPDFVGTETSDNSESTEVSE